MIAMKSFFSCVLFSVMLCFDGHAQQKLNPDSVRNKMQWFADAKL